MSQNNEPQNTTSEVVELEVVESRDPSQGVITPEQDEMLRQQMLKNIIDKVSSGGILSVREEGIYSQYVARPAAPKNTGGRPRNIDEIPESVTSSVVLSSFLDCSESQIRQLSAKKQIHGIGEDGRWPLKENIVSYIQLLREEAKGEPAKLARTRREREEIELENARIDHAVKTGGLLPREDYESLWVDAIVRWRQSVETATYLTAPQKKKLLAEFKQISLEKIEAVAAEADE